MANTSFQWVNITDTRQGGEASVRYSVLVADGRPSSLNVNMLEEEEGIVVYPGCHGYDDHYVHTHGREKGTVTGCE